MQQSIPFVARSGGHSEWSTIDSRGFIIDLSLYSGVEANQEARTGTLRGSILAKPVAVALADAGLFTGTLGKSLVTSGSHMCSFTFTHHQQQAHLTLKLSFGQWKYCRSNTVLPWWRRLNRQLDHWLRLRSNHFRAHDHREWGAFRGERAITP